MRWLAAVSGGSSSLAEAALSTFTTRACPALPLMAAPVARPELITNTTHFLTVENSRLALKVKVLQSSFLDHTYQSCNLAQCLQIRVFLLLVIEAVWSDRINLLLSRQEKDWR